MAAEVSGRRKLFALGNMRFRISQTRMVDAIFEGVSWFVETLVYLIGPLLIMLALSIMALLTYTYFTILVPMVAQKYRGTSIKSLVLVLHTAFVLFLLGSVLFNYFLCVTTRHKGPMYDKVVRELAQATELMYPETPAQIQQYRQDYEDRMFLRMKRRKARAEKRYENNSNSNTTSNGQSQQVVTHRHNSTATATNNDNNSQILAVNAGNSDNRSNGEKKAPVRTWMVMGPLEWGYCRETNQPKPPRSHYDHVSKSLVLNLDHYCPWMFNAIGYFNYRYFVSFLIYILIAMMYGVVVSMEPFLLLRSDAYRKQYRTEKRLGLRPERLEPMLPYRDEKMLVTLSFMLCTAVGSAVLLLGGFHIYLTLTAQTTIEFHGNWSKRRQARAMNRKWANPYSLGSARANWEQVFGRRRWIILSLLPNAREPEFLPVPIPGHPGRNVGSQEDDDNDVEEQKKKEVDPLLEII